MNPLFDMLTQMQDNRLAEQMAARFGLQTEETRQAMAALMPAFSQGLKRNAATPEGFAAFMQALAEGNHQQYYENPFEAFTGSGVEEGNAILGHLFGSKEVSRAVARQAAAQTGLATETLKKMLPVLAPMILGGLFKQMTGDRRGGDGAGRADTGTANPFGQILEQMMRGGFGGGAASPKGKAAPFNPLEDLFKQMTGGRQTGANPGGALGDIFTEMLRGNNPAPRTPQPPEPPEPRELPEENRRPGGFDDLFGEMFNPGRKVDPGYEKNIESIFDEFLGQRRR